MINNQTNERAELTHQVELGQALQTLEKDPNFILLIKSGYIMNTLVVESQNTIDIQPPLRQEAFEKIQSVNYFRQYLTRVKNDAMSALEELNGGDLDE